MGLLRCDSHGMVGFFETCQHVAADIDNKVYGHYYHTGLLLVCEECLHKYHLEPFQDFDLSLNGLRNISPEAANAYSESYQQMQGRTIRCTECVAVAKVEQARRNGERDPFPIFERTLNSHCAETIDTLYKRLLARFQFSPSIAVNDRPAVFISPGAFTYPLTIQIYYVTDSAEQQSIVTFVQDFFRDQRLNQAKIVFLQAEAWETWKNSTTGTSGARRGTELILAEVFLNCDA